MPVRRPLALVLVGATAAALTLAPVAAQAAAPAPAVPSLVDIDTAFGLLPVAQALPGAVRLTLKVQTPGSAAMVPCPETLAELDLKGSLVGAQYETASKKTPLDKTASWAITAVVFHSVKLAKSETARLLKIEKACPKKAPTDSNDDNPFPFVRTKTAAYAVGAWKGYRTVDQISITDLLEGPDPVGERVNTVFLLKDNVLLGIQETGGIQPGTTTRQDLWRRSVTALMLQQFDALT
ncbi:hypothetical protein acdb102_42600 [Acidothermaceae bacterium B102]|nr:hypothetical protein acdb102_42600 [Acidothermaceae bacterium B102]